MRRWALALLVAAAPGCKCTSGSLPVDAGADADDRVRPVYDSTGPAHPLAEKLCAALHQLPEERRAACCHGGAGFTATSLCTGALSAALRGGAVALDAPAV